VLTETFSGGNSVFHRTDPRIKLLTAAFFSILVALSNHPSTVISGLGFAGISCLAARLPFKALLLRLLAVNTFVAVLWIVLPFSTPGTPLVQWGPLAMTSEGVFLSAMITGKTNAIFLTATSLLGTTTIFNLVHALSHMYVPQKLVQLFFFTWRYVQVVVEETSRLRRAMKARCFSPKTDRHTYRSYAHLVSMILVRSIDRSERIYSAMLCRQFNGFFPAYKHFALGPADRLFALISVFVILTIGWMEWPLIPLSY
jgi:cobalt/nickel transport system permease protein